MKVAVLGGNGYLGGRISSEISTHYKTYSITRNSFNHPSCTNIKCDYTNIDKFIELLIGFDVIVNCTGLNKKNSSSSCFFSFFSRLFLCTHRNGSNQTNDSTNDERPCTTIH